MILAVVLFLAPEPVGAASIGLTFRTVPECEAMIDAMASQIERDRLRLQRQHGRPVEAITFCHDMGISA